MFETGVIRIPAHRPLCPGSTRQKIAHRTQRVVFHQTCACPHPFDRYTMTLDSNIQKMLESYADQMSVIDKMREILQQTALLGLARHQFFEHAVFYGGT